MEAPTKPLIIAADEAKQALVNAINEIIQTYNIPFFMLEPTMKSLYDEVSMNAQQERIQAREQYNKACAEYEAAIAEPTTEVVEGEIID